MTPYNSSTFLLFRIERLNAIDQIENPIQIGLKAGAKIKLEHLASFAPKGVATS